MIKILIVEDEIISALALSQEIQRMDYEVCAIVPSAQKAIRMAEEAKPDIVLMDIRLRGEMSGVEAAAEIYIRFKIPSIFMSGYDEANIKNLLDENTAFEYIVKPIEYKKLKLIIEATLAKKNN